MAGIAVTTDASRVFVDFGDYAASRNFGPAGYRKSTLLSVWTDTSNNTIIAKTSVGDYKLSTVEHPTYGMVVDSFDGVPVTTNAQLRTLLMDLLSV
jgi:hypothetical protein